MGDVDDLLGRLARGLAEGAARGVPVPDGLCRVAATTLGCDGGAITIACTDAERVTLCATDDTARRLEELQDVAGQGPGADALANRTYVRLDLREVDDADPRWPLLESTSLPALAPLVVHALPIDEGADGVLGVLTLHQRGAEREIDLDAALIVSRVVGAALLADQPDLREAGTATWSDRAAVRHAVAMVVAQLGVPDDDAHALLRAYAYSHDQSLAETAHSVIARLLTFSTGPGSGIETT